MIKEDKSERCRDEIIIEYDAKKGTDGISYCA